MILYCVTYLGPFAFLKPWSAVRQMKTNSQQFLTPSTITGIEQKLGVAKILRHRLSFNGFNYQQEVIQAKEFAKVPKAKLRSDRKGTFLYKEKSIVQRGVLINPKLMLAFTTQEDAEKAWKQTVCLSRNEDLLFPESIQEMTDTEFDKLPGYEFMPADPGTYNGVMVGFNRFRDGAYINYRVNPESIPMYGTIVFTPGE